MNDYVCSYCHSHYKREKTLETHFCKPKHRLQEIKTIKGQRAYLYYCKWMKSYNRRKPEIETFIQSRQYNAFNTFAGYAIQIKLADVDVFIRLMKERDFAPNLWTHHQVYAFYIEYLDRKVGALENSHITIKTIFKIADAAECKAAEVFDILDINQIIKLVQERRFSPWILLFSPKFKKILREKASSEQLSILNNLIRPMYWSLKFNRHPNEVQIIKKYILEMGL